ncbi:DUF481 domain-containing protein [Rubricoccus marinus]|uniref:Autotransporter domain-containing protein n=1 Tax=Rubricoccus marinus TaxID=716817 RepID=A0A259U307_9BACT|nr:DUF481 domain-containing protein [Rubricoccus marinus]OZC04346.1 hypothetical protein BSZ36_15990 [Rubricoccus marinus]
MSRALAFLLVLLAAASAPLAQEAKGAKATAFRVAYDCRTGGCDRDFFQTELPYVQFVRDQGDADVFVLITGDQTGSGGRRYTLFVEGRGPYKGQESTLTITVPSDATDDDERRAIASRLALGMAGYLAQTAVGERLYVSYDAPPEAAGGIEAPLVDPWNGWTFRLNGNANANGESSFFGFNGSGGASASRATERWKTRVSVYGNYNRREFDQTSSSTGNDTTIVSERSDFGGNGLVARSLGPHLSTGFEVSAGRNTFSNYTARFVLGPGVEYSFFPYAEATSRVITASYSVGMEFAAYTDSTIFDEIQEILPQHSLRARAEFAQPWGSFDLSFTGQQYLSKLERYEAGIGGGLNIRLARGLQLNVGGNASVIQNQLSLAAGDLSPEEILLQQQQQATSFRYNGRVGISYSFGSIFNSAVNTRFDRGGVLVVG